MREQIERLQDATSAASEEEAMVDGLNQLVAAQSRLEELLSAQAQPAASAVDSPTEATHPSDPGVPPEDSGEDSDFDEEEMETMQQAGRGGSWIALCGAEVKGVAASSSC